MGNNKSSAIFDQPLNGILNQLFGFGIHRRGSLVQYKYARISQYRPRDGDSLPLSSGQFYAALTYYRVISLWQRLDEIMRVGCFRRLDDRQLKWADWVITLCDTVKPYSAHFPDTVKYDHWSIPNPDARVSDDVSQEEAYAQTRDDLKRRIEHFLKEIS